MEVIVFETEAFYALIERLFDRLNEANVKHEKWLNPEQAMAKLNIKSKTTLQKYRDEGRIRFSQSDVKRIVLYDADSINAYLEEHAKEPFWH